MREVDSVTYRVWDDFTPRALTTRDRTSDFDLWLTAYGEFPILAMVKMRSGETYELQRYLELPGRPPD